MRKISLMVVLLMAACGGGHHSVGDPLAKDQWYLLSSEGNDIANINLKSDVYYKGRGVVVAIVDNGVDLDHEDLRENIGYGNYSYLTADYDFSNADHGTSVAGIIAAVEGNGVGGRGVAPQSTLLSFNAMRLPLTKNIADALIRGINRVDISNNSWGDFNGWGEPLHLKSEIESALKKGTSDGRGGKGIIYVFSAGNGALIDSNGLPFDNVNYSGLVNNQYTLPICATDYQGERAVYSEVGATLLVCAPSKGLNKNRGIVTADLSGDRGYNKTSTPDDYDDKNYTRYFGGTSAAAPMVSGVIALMLEANPRLTWRDVRFILAKSARKNSPTHPDWSRNGAGLWVNHNFGFGLIDADSAIKASLDWQNLNAQKNIHLEQKIEQEIPDNSSIGLTGEIEVAEDLTVEFVDVYFDAPNHPSVGDLEVVLVSPSGTKSILAEVHNQTLGIFRYNNWRFGSLRCLGETARGKWQLVVTDKQSRNTGILNKWQLTIHAY